LKINFISDNLTDQNAKDLKNQSIVLITKYNTLLKTPILSICFQ